MEKSNRIERKPIDETRTGTWNWLVAQGLRCQTLIHVIKRLCYSPQLMSFI